MRRSRQCTLDIFLFRHRPPSHRAQFKKCSDGNQFLNAMAVLFLLHSKNACRSTWKVGPCRGARRDLHSTKTSKYLDDFSGESCWKMEPLMGRMEICNTDLIIGNQESKGCQESITSDISTSSPAAGTASNISIIITEHVQLLPVISFVLCHCRFPCSEEADDGV